MRDNGEFWVQIPEALIFSTFWGPEGASSFADGLFTEAWARFNSWRGHIFEILGQKKKKVRLTGIELVTFCL